MPSDRKMHEETASVAETGHLEDNVVADAISHESLGETEGDPRLAFRTKLGRAFRGDSAIALPRLVAPESVDLIMTSPPFGLVRKKQYGNVDADDYADWFRDFAEAFTKVLKPTGSLVVDLGGAWNRGQPTRSLYHFEVMIMLCRDYGFHLAQEFYWWNPAKLPSPAQWVTIKRTRVKDAVNCIWWLSKSPNPKASNLRVLQPYSSSMRSLLRNGYQSGTRPSGHVISDRFGTDNGGAIPPNLLALANTESNGAYQRYCRQNGLIEHPARFPVGIPEFFVRMLTDKGDLVVDPFAGSCVTGEAAEGLGRRWVGIELRDDYLSGARGRFPSLDDPTAVAPPVRRRSEPYLAFPPNVMAEELDRRAEEAGDDHA
jgi:DNA modification methylase